MATKKVPASKPKTTSSPAPRRLENLAARPAVFDDTIDDQLVDHSGVFRVTAQIAQAQTGHGDDSTPRFANDSLVMTAQRDGLLDEGPTLDDALDDGGEAEATAAIKRQRLVSLAALAARKQPPPKRSR